MSNTAVTIAVVATVAVAAWLILTAIRDSGRRP